MFVSYTLVIGAIVLLVALCGATLNVLVMRFTTKAKAFQSCFGVLVRFEAAAAMVYNCVFGLYVAPTLLFDIKPLQPRSISARIGQLAVLSHDVCLISHLCISFNRFLAAYFSSRYNSIFTVKRTYVYCCLIIVIAFSITVFHFIEPCWIYFDFTNPAFTYDFSTSCGRTVAFYIQFPRNLAVMVVCTLLNIATYLKVRIINQNVCVQAAVYIVQFFTYFIISPYFIEYPWIVFFMTTFAWQMVHVTDGLAVFAFNRDLRQLIFKRVRPTQTITISVSSRPVSTSMKL